MTSEAPSLSDGSILDALEMAKNSKLSVIIIPVIDWLAQISKDEAHDPDFLQPYAIAVRRFIDSQPENVAEIILVFDTEEDMTALQALLK